MLTTSTTSILSLPKRYANEEGKPGREQSPEYGCEGDGGEKREGFGGKTVRDSGHGALSLGDLNETKRDDARLRYPPTTGGPYKRKLSR
jgi:hypothetical protein